MTLVIDTLPTILPKTLRSPLALTTSGSVKELEANVPNAKTVFVGAATPLAVLLAVLAVSVQGSTLMEFPTNAIESLGKLEEVKVKMHEPKVVTPLAVNPPLVMVTFGVAPVLLKATVVEPRSATGAPAALTPENPLANTTGVVPMAAITEAFAFTVRLVAATGVVATGELPPPPHAVNSKPPAKTIQARETFFKIISIP